MASVLHFAGWLREWPDSGPQSSTFEGFIGPSRFSICHYGAWIRLHFVKFMFNFTQCDSRSLILSACYREVRKACLSVGFNSTLTSKVKMMCTSSKNDIKALKRSKKYTIWQGKPFNRFNSDWVIYTCAYSNWAHQHPAPIGFGIPRLSVSNDFGKARQVYLYSTFHTQW